MELENDHDDDTGEIIDTNIDFSDVNLENILPPSAFSPDPVKMTELENTGLLTRIDLDLAYVMEKLLNLSTLLMHVTAKASDYEALAVDDDIISSDSLEKALEFDLLSGILDWEVRELDNFMSSVEMDIVVAHEKIDMGDDGDEYFPELEVKLKDSEKSLKQLQDAVCGMRMQSSKLQSKIAICGQEFCRDAVLSMKIKMHTAEQQRYILRTLEKSIARELDLEIKLSDTINSEQELLKKLHSMEREICCTEEMNEVSVEKYFEAEHMVEVLMNFSKELQHQLHVMQFNLENSERRADELISKIDLLEKHLAGLNVQLAEARTSVEISQAQKGESYLKICDLEGIISDLNEKILEAEKRAEYAEAKCHLLAENNSELSRQVDHLRSNNIEAEIMDLLEKKLKQLGAELQQAKGMVEADQEKQNVLPSAVDDIGHLIDNLKVKISKAESRADNAEAKCSSLIETNLEQNEEIGILKGRIDYLKKSLQRAEDGKKASAGSIRFQTSIIKDLVVQLAMERERLQIQISSLMKGNLILAEKYGKLKNADLFVGNSVNENVKQSGFLCTIPVTTQYSESCADAVVESSAASLQGDSSVKELPDHEKAGDAITTEGSEPGPIRSIEPTQLKSVTMVSFILLIFCIFLNMIASFFGMFKGIHHVKN